MQQFQPLDYISWIGSVIVEVFVVAIMLRRYLVPRFSFFFVSLAYDLAREGVLATAIKAGPKAYGLGYWLTLPIEYVIAFAVMMEAFRHALGSDPKIPPKTLRLLTIAAVLLVAVAAFLLFHPDIPITNLRALILALDRSIGLLRVGVLLFIWTFARRLGLSWKHHVWGIVFGLGIYSGVGLVVAAIHASTGTLCGDWLARLIPGSYFAATIIWAVYLWRPEPQRGPLTLEQISFFSNSVATYRRILAELWRSFRMILSVSTAVCIAAGIYIIARFILESIRKRRIRRRTIQDSVDAMQRIEDALPQLPHLGARKRAATRRAIAREILLDTEFVLSLVYDCYNKLQESQEVRERAQAVVAEIVHLNLELRKILFLFRFRPRLAGHCQRVLAAVEAHCLVWLAFIRFLKATYPEHYAKVSIPDSL